MAERALIYRQRLLTRLTHWVWAVSLFFLLLTGLQIFNAHPTLHLGQEAGWQYDNAILDIGARQEGERLRGVTRVFGWELDTTGVLGVQGETVQAFPSALTIPSQRSLATGRVIHFFFAWVLGVTLLVWLGASLFNGHLRQVIPGWRDLAGLPRDIWAHLRLRFSHGAAYNPLQKLTYAGVLFGLFPLIILTGLSMSPAFNALAPWTLDLFGGRQTARTLHFAAMLGLAGFFVVHILMVLVAGPLNELRSIVTGWYRVGPEERP